MSNKDRPLSVRVHNGEIVVRVGIDQLASAIAHGSCFHDYDDAKGEYVRSFAISNATEFARDIAIAMEREKEDGSSPLSEFFDAMAWQAIDDGSTGVEYDQQIAFEEKSPLETWQAKGVTSKILSDSSNSLILLSLFAIID